MDFTINRMSVQELLSVVGYGSKVVVVEAKSDKELLNTDDFQCPYSFKGVNWRQKFDVVCVSVSAGYLVIWVEERG